MFRSSRLFAALGLVAAVAASAQAAPAPGSGNAPALTPLTVAAICAHTPLYGEAPGELRWSPDSRHLTYFDDGRLMELDPNTLATRPLVDRARIAAHSGGPASEFDRDHRSRYAMAGYQWSPDGSRLLFDSDGLLWLDEPASGRSRDLLRSESASSVDPKFSPDGRSISYLSRHGLMVLRLDEPNATPLALAPADEAVLNGEVDWVYAEELSARSNYFWSPDSTRIAYLQTDEHAVPLAPLTDWIPTHATVDQQRYPQPGDPNPAVRLGVVRAAGGPTLWIDLPIQANQDYIPRFGWTDERTLWIERLSRDQRRRELYFAYASTGRSRLALSLADDKFFDENYEFAVGSGLILFTNWADGHNHLYLYGYDQAHPAAARPLRQLTRGDFEVDEIVRVDLTAGVVDFTSNEPAADSGPLDRQLWEVDFAGHRRRLTLGSGFHAVTPTPSGRLFVDRHSTRATPPTLSLCRPAEPCRTFWQPQSLVAYGLRPPSEFTLPAEDGTPLHATLLMPDKPFLPASVPLVVNPYGGPGAQAVLNRWSDALLFDQLLTQHGFAVLHADNRGSAGRGRAFAQAAWHNFGPVQLTDQLAAVDAALASHPELDRDRLGWWGWSWGGSFTLYALTHSPRFRAGVAVAPVTDWLDYDSIYTERYLGLPADHPELYRDFSVVHSAERLSGALLIAHGTGDDNVHFQNSVQFADRLIAAGRPYRLEIYPRKTHSIAGPEARTHLYQSIYDHFQLSLSPSATRPQPAETGAAQ